MTGLLGFFIFGLILGSFLNVCIHRMPKGESIVLPGSRCPVCRHAIAWQDNLPVISFILLKGQCRHCHAGISWRYPLMETVTGLMLAGLFFKFGFTWDLAAGAVFCSLLLAVIFTDLETGLIPDALTLPGAGLGLLLSVLYPPLMDQEIWWRGLGASLAGFLAGGALIWLTAWLGELIFRKESMGGGDLKLLAMMGAFLGIQKVCLAYFLAPIFALPVALYVKVVKKEEIMPYGPYLSLAGAVLYVYGDWMMAYFYGN